MTKFNVLNLQKSLKFVNITADYSTTNILNKVQNYFNNK